MASDLRSIISDIAEKSFKQPSIISGEYSIYIDMPDKNQTIVSGNPLVDPPEPTTTILTGDQDTNPRSGYELTQPIITDVIQELVSPTSTSDIASVSIKIFVDDIPGAEGYDVYWVTA